MKNDIANRFDLEVLINAFYEKAIKDEVIGFFFTEVVQMHWETHLPVMYTFWENVLFYTGGYNGNPMTIHMAIHQKSPMKHEHFERWVSLFSSTVDELFEGEKAEQIKQKAQSIALVMEIKISS